MQVGPTGGAAHAQQTSSAQGSKHTEQSGAMAAEKAAMAAEKSAPTQPSANIGSNVNLVA